jgi:RNA polymerase sigma factor (sigma-70 family)
MLDMIQQLTPVYRMVFNLYAIEGYTHKEIAEQLGIAEGTSKSNLSKARQKLRKMLEKYLTEPPENVRSI